MIVDAIRGVKIIYYTCLKREKEILSCIWMISRFLLVCAAVVVQDIVCLGGEGCPSGLKQNHWSTSEETCCPTVIHTHTKTHIMVI